MTCAWRQAGAVVRYLSFLAHPALLGVLDCALKKKTKIKVASRCISNKNKNLCTSKCYRASGTTTFLGQSARIRFHFFVFGCLLFWGLFGFGVFLLSFLCLLASDTNLQPIWGQVINFACQLLGHCLHANLLYCLTMQCLYKGCVWIQQILLSTITST